MARGTQLLQLVTMLRDEVGRSASVTVGVDDLPGLKNKLRRNQELLYDEYDWPFLRQIFPRKQLNAGEQYYDFPAGLNLERVESVYVWYSNIALPIQRGISEVDYSIYNPYLGVTSEPMMKWDVRWTGTKEQMEAWPIPATNTQLVGFTGIRTLRPLIADADVADLDDQLIVLTTAAEILARQGSASAEAVGSAAKERKTVLHGRVQGASKMRRMGMGSEAGADGRIPVVVHARST